MLKNLIHQILKIKFYKISFFILFFQLLYGNNIFINTQEPINKLLYFYDLKIDTINNNYIGPYTFKDSYHPFYNEFNYDDTDDDTIENL